MDSLSFQNRYLKRAKDWRNGAIIYQVIVDRFSKPENIDAKKHLYLYPKSLKSWDTMPKAGIYLNDVNLWSHEIEFWGGDLRSLTNAFNYINDLNVDILYLNPIHQAITNHKYDASNYMEISHEYGTMDDLKTLVEMVHSHNKKIVLDGVFNHLGRNSELFQKALDKNSKYHNWFDFNPHYPEGVRLWANVKSLPELNFLNQEVRNYIYKDDHSVIKHFLKVGVDGWRLDVAFELGYEILSELTNEAHSTKENSLVVGEIWNYPKDWLKVIDGVINFTFREIILKTVQGKLSSQQAMKMINQTIENCGIEGILKSWNVLDNHDVPRLMNLIPNEKDRKIAQLLQFMLPGSPNLYYGTELGMTGEGDPSNRSPMRWDLVNEQNEHLLWIKKLIDLHQKERALKIGDYLPAVTEKLIVFERYTNKVDETVIVVINPNNEIITESVLIQDSKLMNNTLFTDILNTNPPQAIYSGIMNLTLNKKSFMVLKPQTFESKGYTPYKNIE